jgi:hypothetical protein
VQVLGILGCCRCRDEDSTDEDCFLVPVKKPLQEFGIYLVASCWLLRAALVACLDGEECNPILELNNEGQFIYLQAADDENLDSFAAFCRALGLFGPAAEYMLSKKGHVEMLCDCCGFHRDIVIVTPKC